MRRRILVATSLILASGFWLLASLPPQDTLKVDVNLVSIVATVKDAGENFVTDLTREDFRVYDDDQLQDIQIFEKQGKVDSSIAILMDTSGSMVDILPFMRTGVRDFTTSMSSEDQYSVVSFGTTVRLIHSSGQSRKHLEDSLQALRAYGTSAMYDGLEYAIEKVDASDRPRKAVIIFTDGNDSGSKTDYGRIVRKAQQSGVLLYFIAIGSRLLIDTRTLESLSELTAGRTFYVAKGQPVSPVLGQVRTELTQQYYLGYYAPRRPGFHRIRVELPYRELTIRAKTGYIGG
jgi:Ca-activated chloride channel family protein